MKYGMLQKDYSVHRGMIIPAQTVLAANVDKKTGDIILEQVHKSQNALTHAKMQEQLEQHPWMGLDRYHTAQKMLDEASEDFAVSDCFEILKAVSPEVCPTVVSMVFDVTEMTVYWCENRQWYQIQRKTFAR